MMKLKQSGTATVLPPQEFKYNDLSWSLWDRWILEGDLTVQQVEIQKPVI